MTPQQLFYCMEEAFVEKLGYLELSYKQDCVVSKKGCEFVHTLIEIEACLQALRPGFGDKR